MIDNTPNKLRNSNGYFKTLRNESLDFFKHMNITHVLLLVCTFFLKYELVTFQFTVCIRCRAFCHDMISNDEFYSIF